MERKNILAIWQACKSLITQAEEYTNKKDTNSKVPKEILNAIETNFTDVISFIQTYILQNQKASFYGLVLMEFESGIKFSQRGVIDLDVKQQPFKLTYNPFFAKNYSINELIGISLNEVVKLIYMHPVTFAKLNHNKDEETHKNLEIGSSVSSTELINRDIRLDGNNNRVRLPDDIYTKADLDEAIYNSGKTTKSTNCTESLEYYYNAAKAYVDHPKSNGDINISNDPSSVATPDNNNGSRVHNWESCDKSDTEDNIKDIIKTVYDASQQRGELPFGLQQYIEALFKAPELNWKQMLRHMLGVYPSGKRPCKERLNRLQPDRFDLHGTLADKHVRIVIGIDTSGSMTDRAISYCLNEVYNIAKCYKTEITVIECDSAIGKIYQLKRPSDINIHVTGRGGTSFKPVIEYINEHKYKDALMIYFTDGYGDYEIEKPRTYRNMWVVMGSEDNLSLKQPYGVVKSLKSDPDYK